MKRPLNDCIDAYRRGEKGAPLELLVAAEPLLRRYVQTSMGDKLRSLEESIDVSQSLMLAFHVQVSAHKVEFENENALKGYLRTMVRHKLANRADAMSAAKRGGGAIPASLDDEASLPLPTNDLTASIVARVSETKSQIDEELDEEEQAILEGRLMGLTNREIADRLGKTADAVRMVWNRSRSRLVQRQILRDPRESQ